MRLQFTHIKKSKPSKVTYANSEDLKVLAINDNQFISDRME